PSIGLEPPRTPDEVLSFRPAIWGVSDERGQLRVSDTFRRSKDDMIRRSHRDTFHRTPTDGIARGLEFLGGVYEVMRFDNLTQAVARVLKGHRRQEQDRFIAFRSHYGFASSFTTP